MHSFALLSLLLTACDSESAEPAASVPPLPASVAAPAAPAAATAVPAAAPAAATTDHHCRVTPSFNCAVGSKVLSVCEMETGLSYRFGPIGTIEKQYPPPSTESHFEYSAVTTVSAEGHSLKFTTEGHTYEVTEMSGAGGPNAEANNFTGVVVYKGDEHLSSIACTGAAQSDWEAIERMAAFVFSDMGAP
ncbi:MAG: hypothetical protein ACI8RZ_007498 [Myxococcota bacterium]|jgi:hypothetical protein